MTLTPTQKRERFRDGRYWMGTPPVQTFLWGTDDWTRWIDKSGGWL